MPNDTPRPSFDLVISIINYRTAEMTLTCVQSVLDDFALDAQGQHDRDLSAHVVVVDNDSGDGSADVIADWIASQPSGVPVTLVRSETNSGFSGGHNQGLTAFPAEFYLVLNSDAILRPGFCQSILAAAYAAPEIGLFAPRLEYEDGTQQVSCFRIPTPASEMIRGAATGPVTRLLKSYDVPLSMPPAEEQIGWASFACILLRGEMIRQIGLMDEGYFLYFEDTEYCLRAKRGGWGIRYVPEARAVHYRGGSAPVKSLAKERKRLPAYYYASRTRLFYQAHGRAGLIAANLLWHAGRGIAFIRKLVGKPVPSANASEARDIWINASKPLGSSHAPGR